LDGEGNVQGNYTIGTQGTLTDQNDALVYNFDAKGTITDADGKEKYKLTAEKLIKDANGAIQYTYAEFSSGDIRFEIKDLSGNTQYTCDNYGGIREGKTTTGDVLYNFDGTNVTTTDGSGSVTIKYTVADGKVTEQKTGNFVYVFGTFNVVKSKNSIAYTYDADGNITDSTGNISYTYDKTAGTIAGNGVIYRVNTETVVLDTNKDTVYKVDADNTVRDPKGTILYRVYTDPVSGAKSVIDAKKSNNDNQVFVLNTNGDLLIQNAKNKDGESLLQEWEAYRGNTSIYGFYDGVFTFALSSGTDSIKNIWPDYADGSGGTSSPVFSLGEDSDDAWKIDKLPDGFEYYYEMEEVKNHTSFNSADDNYLITWTDSATREIYLMDLNTPGTKVGAIALSSLGGIISTSETALRITWDSISARSNLDKYWIGINGTSVKSKYSNHPLGIQRTTFNWGLFENDSSFDIYCGENENKKPSFLSYGYYYSYDVVINYNNGFQLSLTNKKTRYVEGSSSGFSFGEDSSYYGLKIYRMTKRGVQEQTSDKYGYKPIDEVNSDSEGNLLYANQHVLSPKSTALVEDTTSTYENGAYNYPVYELQSVSSLGWKDAQGNSLSTVSKMLNMGEGITWDIQFDVLGGLIDTSANNKLVNAPIGSKGETTNIPIGCLAFRINKVPEGGAKIRVITACPSTKSYGSLKTDEDYYFGIWKSETKTFLGGLIKYNVFSKTNAIEKFELPRSQAKAMGEAGADGVPTKTEEGLKDYIRIQYGDKTYRTYLQGDIYLIAYEFTVSEEGIYIMGASNGPMQIVYFSSDGVSDDGRDGTGGTQIGFVDFVYDYSPTTATDPKRIVLVTDTELKHTGNKTDTEDYQYYYESNCLVHFGNAQGEPPIWDELVYIRRRRFETVSPDDKEIWLSVSAYSDDLNESVQCSKYALLGDNIGYWNSETTAPIEGVKYGKRSVSTGE
jgi:hypothetical protein